MQVDEIHEFFTEMLDIVQRMEERSIEFKGNFGDAIPKIRNAQKAVAEMVQLVDLRCTMHEKLLLSVISQLVEAGSISHQSLISNFESKLSTLLPFSGSAAKSYAAILQSRLAAVGTPHTFSASPETS